MLHVEFLLSGLEYRCYSELDTVFHLQGILKAMCKERK